MKKSLKSLIGLCLTSMLTLSLLSGCAKKEVKTNVNPTEETVSKTEPEDNYKLVLKLSHVFSPAE